MLSADDFYWYTSVFIFLPWILLVVAPTWRYTEPVSFGAAIILLLAAAFYTIRHLTGSDAGGDLISLSGFESVFRNKEMLLTGWLNYLSFCLLVGTWQVHDARQQDIPHLLVAPALILTMLTGPAGLLLYLLIRFLKTRKWEIK
jgi:hypothetical protein